MRFRGACTCSPANADALNVHVDRPACLAGPPQSEPAAHVPRRPAKGDIAAKRDATIANVAKSDTFVYDLPIEWALVVSGYHQEDTRTEQTRSDRLRGYEHEALLSISPADLRLRCQRRCSSGLDGDSCLGLCR